MMVVDFSNLLPDFSFLLAFVFMLQNSDHLWKIIKMDTQSQHRNIFIIYFSPAEMKLNESETLVTKITCKHQDISDKCGEYSDRWSWFWTIG